MDEGSLRDIFSNLEEQLVKLGFEVESVSEEVTGDQTYLFMNCSRGNEPLQFIGAVDSDWEHVILRYPFDVLENLAVDLRRRDKAQQKLDDLESEDYVERASNEISQMDIPWDEVKYGLAERLISENCYFIVDDEGDLPLTAFYVDKKIFPKNGVDIEDLNSSIQTVLGRGKMGRIWLADCLDKTRDIFSMDYEDVGRESSESDEPGYIR